LLLLLPLLLLLLLSLWPAATAGMDKQSSIIN
jgi:hypothetical protein